MSLAAGCPRCSTPVAHHGADGEVSCPEHGVVRALWRSAAPSYDEFMEHLELADGMPTYLPWPLAPGWQVSDFAVAPGEATLTVVTGTSDLDGAVEIVIVAEETGVGLGPRVAGTGAPRHGMWGEPPSARVRVEGQPVPLWPVSTLDGDDHDAEWDRSVLAGESAGRWLWLVVRPAAAVLLLQDDWALRDVSRLGMALVEVPFGGSATGW